MTSGSQQADGSVRNMKKRAMNAGIQDCFVV
ncbi:hypothetical protein LEMLEM_LOCUS17801 [Lemmus lemmus]